MTGPSVARLPRGQAAFEVENRMFSALAVLRAILVLNTLVMTHLQWENVRRPGLALLVVGTAVAWSGLSTWLYAHPHRRRTWVFVVDLTVALVGLLASPVAKGESFNAALLGFWLAAPVLAWAVRWHLVGGLVAAVILGATDLGLRQEVTTNEWGNVFLLLVSGVVVGHLSATVQQMAEQRARAEREAAAATERTRLARVVHDGVLQVLALVHRAGTQPDPDVAELSRLAGEQEASLRAMIRQQERVPGAPSSRATHDTRAAALRAALAGPGRAREAQPSRSATTDLTVVLEGLASSRITVATTGSPVWLPAHTVSELHAAVREALANVARHVGSEAPAWLLVEETPEQVVVTVRDEGPGITPEALAKAEAEGRLGVVSSIRGRLRDLGGDAVLTSDRWGTEWELRVPRAPITPPAPHQAEGAS